MVNMVKKRGVSPIISTVLLVMVVIVMAIIILLWARGFASETILKNVAGQEKTVDKFCADVRLEAFVDNDGTFGFSNVGNIPLFSYNVKIVEAGSSEIHERNEIVNPGASVRIEDLGNYNNFEEVKIIPVLLGTKKTGGSSQFTCPERDSILV